MMSDWTSLGKVACRVMRQTPARLLWKFAWNFGWRNLWNMHAFEKRQKRGEEFYPAFNMISVTETCNLACSGCWVTAGGKKRLSVKQIDGIINDSKRHGSYFFGILGGEPLMYDGLMDIFKKHKDCYFQLFTNATMLTDEIAMQLREAGNVTPLISIEGLEDESDRRRQRSEVYKRTLRGVRACRKAGLIFGVAASICQSNYKELVSREHIERVAKEGAAYLWYYIYRPVGADAHPENALTKEQIRGLREFLIEERRDAPVVLVDVYWDEKGKAMCPGATGMSHHVSPSGALEFCPVIQMATDFLNEDASNMTELYKKSDYLKSMREDVANATRGCILMDNPQLMVKLLEKHPVKETTSRQTAMEEYKAMLSVAGHDMGEEALPEKSAPYRWLKKNYFFGFGAYG
ncbi:MAG: radical SAM protein [Prevotellaceae bacterium]|nr:radical SAM protein [Candidatus Minthosoma equi]